MIIKKEISLADFEAWSGGWDVLKVLKDKGLCEELEKALEFEEPEEGYTDTALNDLLWFECDHIARLLGFDNWTALEHDGDEEEEEEEKSED